MRNILMLLGLVVSAAACSSGFVEGWVDRERVPQGTDEEQCGRRKGHTWVAGTCAKTEDLNLADIASEDQCNALPEHLWVGDKCLPYAALNEEQCGQVVDWAWFEGQCHPSRAIDCMDDPAKVFVENECRDRPTVAIEGAVTQATVVGAPIQPLKLTLSGGAVAQLRQQSCTDFFRLEANQVLSKDGFETNGGASTCTADLVAVAGAAESKPVRLTTTIEPGFFTACMQKHPNPEANETGRVLFKALKKTTCEDATKALREITELKIDGDGVKDLTVFRGLSKLAWLDVSGHEIEDVSPLADLPSLAVLDLSGNPVKSIAPLAKLPKLNILFLADTPLALGQVAKTDESCPTADGLNAAVTSFCKQK